MSREDLFAHQTRGINTEILRKKNKDTKVLKEKHQDVSKLSVFS